MTVTYDDASVSYDDVSVAYDGAAVPAVTYPQITVKVCLADPFVLCNTTWVTWLDITDWVLKCETTYGRQHELQQIEAGTVTLDMDDRYGQFSSWNTTGPYVNQLSLADSSVDPSLPGFGWTLNPEGQSAITLPFATALFGTGTSSNQLPYGVNVVGVIDIYPEWESSTYADAVSGMFPVTVGQTYTISCGIAAGASVSCQLGMYWYNSAGTFLSSTFGSDLSVTTTNQTFTGTVTPPSGAASGALAVRSLAAAGANNYVYIFWPCVRQHFNDPATGQTLGADGSWGPGGVGIGEARPVQVLQDGTPIAFGYINQNDPDIPNELDKTSQLPCSDILALFENMALIDSLYPYQVITDGAVLYWPLNEPTHYPWAHDLTLNGNTGVLGSTPVPTGSGTAIFGGDAGRAGSTNTGLWLGPGAYCATCLPAVATEYAVTGNTSVLGGVTAGVPTGSLPGCSYELWLFGSFETGLFSFGWNDLYVSLGQNENTPWILVNTPSSFYTVEPLPSGWIHIVMTYNNSNGDFVLYVNGVKEQTGSTSSGQTSSGLPAQLGIVGGWESNISEFSVGAAQGCFVTDWAVYPTALTAAQVEKHYTLGTSNPYPDADMGTTVKALLAQYAVPTQIQSIQAGISQLDLQLASVPFETYGAITPGTSMLGDTFQQLLMSDQGALFQSPDGTITFWNRWYLISNTRCVNVQWTATNDGSTSGVALYAPGVTPVIDDMDLWNLIPTEDQTNNIPALAANRNSMDRFGSRSLQGYTSLVFVNQSDTIALGQWLLALYQYPVSRIRSMKLSSVANGGTNMTYMAGAQLFDLVEVEYYPQDSGLPFIERAQIEQMSHTIMPGQVWVTEYQLDPYVFGSGSWLILSDPNYGTLAATNATGNRLAF